MNKTGKVDTTCTDTRENDALLTPGEVARLLRLNTKAIYSLTRTRGRVRADAPLPVVRLHRKALRFRKRDVLEWIELIARKDT